MFPSALARSLTAAVRAGSGGCLPGQVGAQRQAAGLDLQLHRRQRQAPDLRPADPGVHGRDQRLLNSDGSVKQVLPPTMTADERAAYEARQQDEALARAQQREAVRRDRNLLQRFPNEAAHQKAREAALDDTRKSLKVSEARLEALRAGAQAADGRAGVLRRQAAAAQAPPGDRCQRRRDRGAAQPDPEPEGRAGSRQQAVRRRTGAPAQAVGRRPAGLAGRDRVVRGAASAPRKAARQ